MCYFRFPQVLFLTVQFGSHIASNSTIFAYAVLALWPNACFRLEWQFLMYLWRASQLSCFRVSKSCLRTLCSKSSKWYITSSRCRSPVTTSLWRFKMASTIEMCPSNQTICMTRASTKSFTWTPHHFRKSTCLSGLFGQNCRMEL